MILYRICMAWRLGNDDALKLLYSQSTDCLNPLDRSVHRAVQRQSCIPRWRYVRTSRVMANELLSWRHLPWPRQLSTRSSTASCRSGWSCQSDQQTDGWLLVEDNLALLQREIISKAGSVIRQDHKMLHMIPCRDWSYQDIGTVSGMPADTNICSCTEYMCVELRSTLNHETHVPYMK